MYLGANGWYWRIAWHPSLPGVIEVRRAEATLRNAEANLRALFDNTLQAFILADRSGRSSARLVGTIMARHGGDNARGY